MRKVLIPAVVAAIIVSSLVAWILSARTDTIEQTTPSSSHGGNPLPGTPVGATPAVTSEGLAPPPPADPGEPPVEAPVLHGRVTSAVVDHEKTDGSAYGLDGAAVHVRRLERSLEEEWERDRTLRHRLLERTSELLATDTPPAVAAAPGTGSGETPSLIATTVTSGGGYYSIPLSAIPPGKHEVIARYRDHAAESTVWTWSPESCALDFHLGRGEPIGGRVFGGDGRPLEGAVVEAYSHPDGRQQSRRTLERLVDRQETDENGAFWLGVPAGSFRLLARAGSHAPREVNRVEAGTPDIEIHLDAGETIEGRVFTTTASPIQGALISIVHGTGTSGVPGMLGRQTGRSTSRLWMLRPLARTVSDDNGRFAFDNLGSGRYSLSAEKPGFVPARTVMVVEGDGQALPLQFALRAGIRLSGVVQDEAGNFVSGAFVLIGQESRTVRPTRPGAPAGTGNADGPPDRLLPVHDSTAACETDAAGRFQVDTLPEGTYSVSVESAAHLPCRVDGIAVRDAAGTGIEIVLSRGVDLQGKVLSADDETPLAGAIVRARAGPSYRREVRTRIDGRYAIGGLAPGSVVDFQVAASGFSTMSIDAHEVTSNPEDLDFRLLPPVFLHGVVVDARGAPVPAARVVISPAVESGGASNWRARRRRWTDRVETRTDPVGRFHVEYPNGGSRLEVSIEHPHFKPLVSEALPIRPGARLEDLHYRLADAGRLEVRVLRPGATPAAGVRVRVVKDEAQRKDTDGEGRRPERGALRVTNVDGLAVFSRLDEGFYTVTARVRGYQPFAGQVQVFDDDLGSLTIDLLDENVITGVVAERDGTPVYGAWVEAARAEDSRQPEESVEARTNLRGVFRVGSLGRGTYTLRVRAQGFVARVHRAVKVNSNVSVLLERPGEIAGVVANAENGQAVPKFEIVFLRTDEAAQERSIELAGWNERWNPAAGPRRAVVDDPEGKFSVTGLAPGDYLLDVRADGYSPAELRVVVEDGTRTEETRILLAGEK